MFETIQIAVEFCDHGCSAGVDIHIQLLEISLRTINRTHSPAKRLASRFPNSDSRECVPFFIQPAVPVLTPLHPLNVDQLHRLIHCCYAEYQNTPTSSNPSCSSN